MVNNYVTPIASSIIFVPNPRRCIFVKLLRCDLLADSHGDVVSCEMESLLELVEAAVDMDSRPVVAGSLDNTYTDCNMARDSYRNRMHTMDTHMQIDDLLAKLSFLISLLYVYASKRRWPSVQDQVQLLRLPVQPLHT